ncbi:hypothetical protein AVEN_101835-1 [Araneus ventricosus]|uniref:BTB domain-containing protein n=1 Tax=Araneus ventricosus TaxID=182803 RepID=A0A4Y2RKD6_ARAVE|nr:hypothetical protein AVEN_101835-1 [Araneus ventricosus]
MKCSGQRLALAIWLRFKSVYQLLDFNREFYDATDLKAFHCKIGVLDSNNSVVKLLVNKFLDTESAAEGYLSFPLITVHELLKNKSLYLPNGKLDLDCEFTLCYGLQHGRIEGITRNATFTSALEDETASTSQIFENTPSSLENDFLNLLQEGTLCDFTINVEDKNLQVHKAVLYARSPVFKAMLTCNMKEKENNMVDISDLELDTVLRMLSFMYTDMAGNLDWATAYKLYFAANKYGLITLKRTCSKF